MQDMDLRFSGSVPANYEQYMVPLLFRPYAELMAHRAADLGARRILETAAGTGVVTGELARALPDAKIVATDLNQPMLDVAAERVSPPTSHSSRRMRSTCRSRMRASTWSCASSG